MKKIYLFILILISACSAGKKDEIMLYNKQSVKMFSGEKQVPLSKSLLDTYEHYFNNDPSAPAPLMKIIKHKDYELFLGMPLNTTFEIFSSKKSASAMTTSFFQKKEDNGKYMAEYAVAGPDSSTLYLTAITEYKSVSDTLFNEAFFSSRIHLIK